ncbi:M23 family metallopeptidase [Nocardioides mangrovicus]|uniref:M23 family metallopeptidase n=1 Tax=Nocardioides mangrovicus TaxID=2478913 RepID=UPI001E61AA84|nr:M23 family metallopeptidase [Nocardioides mangrovicus]
MLLLLSTSTAASTAASTTASTTASTAAPGPGPVPVGQGAWPLDPRPAVVRGFDPPDSPYGRGHRGVDLQGRLGQAVRTSLAGTVTFASGLGGRGVVVVDHGAVRTTYEPVTALVHVGDTVARGQPIGTLQLLASHCAPRACLHWGLLQGSTYLDPLLLVGGEPVRLLPLQAGATSATRAAPVRGSSTATGAGLAAAAGATVGAGARAP